jgi:Copper type II ascorbate-dependent monooxygenase, C-terminal domain
MSRAFGLGLVVVLLAPPAFGSARSFRAHLRRPQHGLQVRLSPITIAPASEREVCRLVTLRNRRAMDASEITMAMPAGATYTSHHFAIFLYEGDDPAGIPRGPFDRPGCAGVGDQVVSPILAFVQRAEQTIRFPSGVAVRLAPHQRLLLNSHYLNGGTEPVTIDVAVNFVAARKRTVRHHARSFQLGTFDIDVPPGQTGNASAAWVTPFPMNVVWLSTHSHKHTESVDVDLIRQGVVGPLELETLVYSSPTVNLYPTPLRLEAGDGFRWTCNYLNDTTRTLTFGVTSNDEMCFTVGFFYPDDDAAPLPPVAGCFGAGAGLVCPFNH